MSEGTAPPPKKACPAGTSGGQPPWLLVRSDHQPLGEVEGAFASPYPITAGATRPHGLSVDFGRGSAAGRPTAGGFGGWADQTEQSGELVGGFTPSANGGGFGSTAGNRLPVNSTPRSALRVRDGNIERGGALSRGASASGGGSVCTPAPGCRGAPRPGVENTPLRPMALAEGAFTAVGNAQISSGTPGAWQASSALKCRLDLRPSAELAGMVRALRAEKQQLQTQLTAAHNAVLEGNHRNGADVQRESRARSAGAVRACTGRSAGMCARENDVHGREPVLHRRTTARVQAERGGRGSLCQDNPPPRNTAGCLAGVLHVCFEAQLV